ncbi:MAG: B12-binding domain-containing radical SAM protein [Pseudomonadota bacterium]
MARVLLLNPPCRGRPKLRDMACGESTKADYYWAPADLVMLSGLLDRDHEVRVLDAAVEGLDPRRALDVARSHAPDVVFSLTAAVTLDEDAAFLRALRDAVGAPIHVLGDVPSFLPELARRRLDAADELIRDFSDPALVELAAGASGWVPGTAASPLRIPRPRHDLFPLMRYRMPFTAWRGCATVLTATGCPFRCTFCASHGLPHHLRPIPDVVDELTAIRQLGIREVYIRDLTFGPNRARALALSRVIADADLGLRWSAECRAEVLDDEVLEAMAAAGCEVILVGVETGSEAVARRLGKPVGHRALPVLSTARRLGIRTCAHFVIGVPSEGREDVEATLRLARELPLDYASFNLYAPRPGSALWQDLVDRGRVDPDDPGSQDVSLRAESFGDVDASALRALFRRGVLSFYFRPSQVLRLVRSTPWSTLLRQGTGVLRLLMEAER